MLDQVCRNDLMQQNLSDHARVMNEVSGETVNKRRFIHMYI